MSSSSQADASPSDEKPLKLTLIDPRGQSSQFEVTKSPFRIGRLPGCELSLPDSRISRKHAQILLEGGTYYLEDCGSRNGLFVNDQRVERCELHAGDRIDFGVEGSHRIVVGEQARSAAPLIRQAAHLSGEGAAGDLGRLSAVLDVARAVQGSLSLEDILRSAVDAALVVTNCTRGFLMLHSDRHELEVKVARGRNGQSLPEDDLRVPRSLIGKALLARRDLLSMSFDPARIESGGPAGHTIQSLDLRTIVCVPLVKIRMGREHETSLLSTKDDTLGVLYMDSREAAADLSSGNRKLLETLAIEISTVLENSRLLEEERKRKNLEQQLAVARDIQQSMLPSQLPQQGWLVANGGSQACYQVGGDYFDVMPLGEDCWGVVLADVSGKGVSAALMASLIQGVFFAAGNVESRLADTVSRINRYICDRSRNARFVTVFHSLIASDGAMRWINAGHCPALLARANGDLERLEASAVPLGVFPDSRFPVQELQLAAGDKLVIYSDGVSEATNWSREQFGEQRLARIVMENRAASPAELYETLNREVSAFMSGASQNDDLTLLVLGYQG